MTPTRFAVYKKVSRRLALAGSLAICIASCAAPPARDAAMSGKFVAAWSVSQGRIAEQAPALDNSTVRVIVRPTIDGAAVRIKLENTIATTPVTFAAVYVGTLAQGAGLAPGSNRQLTFSGQQSLTLQPGAGAYSDPAPLPVRAFERVAISMDVVSAQEISTHALGLASSYYASGHKAQSESGAGFQPLPSMAQNVTAYPIYWVTALDVMSSSTRGAIVALGDSITDGRCSTTDSSGKVLPDLYQRWPDVLADRLAPLPASYSKAVVNAGIAGNRVLEDGPTGPAALTRLDRDVLDRAGATHVILFEGTNDIFRDATAAELIAGMKQIIDRVHARGVKIVGATIIPRGKPESAPGESFTAEHERRRLEVNEWIRNEAAFDGVIDFDAVMTGGGVSPTGAQMMKPEYSCDFVHPNAAGYRALGEAIDLSLFE